MFFCRTKSMSVEDRSWMYGGWHDNGCHSDDWVHNTDMFLDHAFQGVPNADKFGVVCPCSNCRNRVRRKRTEMSFHLCKWGYMPGYTRWTEHGERPISLPSFQENYDTTDPLHDMLDNLGDAMNTDFVEDEPTADANFTQQFRMTLQLRMSLQNSHSTISLKFHV